MVFVPLHWVPSALAAILTISLAFVTGGRNHRNIGLAASVFGVLGLIGYISAGNFRFYPFDFHVVHTLMGLATLLLTLYIFISRSYFKKEFKDHCSAGNIAAFLAAVTLIMGVLMLTGLVFVPQAQEQSNQSISVLQEPATSKLPEVEATEFQGIRLLPISEQGNNAILGTQHINRSSYRLKLTGMVQKELSMSYDDLLALPAYSEVVYMPCVEGWGFNAKWTGFRVTDLLNLSGQRPEAKYAVFYSVDGYSTSLPLEYIRDYEILMAYGINDLTLPPDRGFPFQLVAKSRYGYKWAKWINSIELTDEDVRGYWESRGYSNSAVEGGLPFG